MPEGLTKLERAARKRSLMRYVAHQEKLQRGCDKCGYNSCAAALEWHHPNDDKNFNPSEKLGTGTLKDLKQYREETKDCNLLCANCHREEHFLDKELQLDIIQQR